ncbi:Uncharacterized protein dnm_081480 [Desulfonema magnum]|uniref:Uncharacterized protein n=1 Tax=Desulfonema magnum TaxID=45655 RepID=A0A975BUN9_9BACT|nr:Uncharacterized protein dnm_081480 [Desulfonema magnum]
MKWSEYDSRSEDGILLISLQYDSGCEDETDFPIRSILKSAVITAITEENSGDRRIRGTQYLIPDNEVIILYARPETALDRKLSAETRAGELESDK